MDLKCEKLFWLTFQLRTNARKAESRVEIGTSQGLEPVVLLYSFKVYKNLQWSKNKPNLKYSSNIPFLRRITFLWNFVDRLHCNGIPNKLWFQRKFFRFQRSIKFHILFWEFKIKANPGPILTFKTIYKEKYWITFPWW